MKRLFEMVGGILGKKSHKDYMASGAAEMQSENYAEAERHYARALEIAEEQKAHDDIAEINLQLATIAEQIGKLAVAETHYRNAYQTFEENEEYENAARCLMLLGRLYYKQRRVPDAEQVLQYAMSIYQSQMSPNHPGIAEAAAILADCLIASKSYAEAQKLLRRAISIDEMHKGKEDPAVAKSLHKLAVCFDSLQQDSDAQDAYKQAIALYTTKESDFDKRTAHDACACYHDYGRFYLQRGKQTDAKPLLQKAMTLADQYPGYLDEADLADKAGSVGA